MSFQNFHGMFVQMHLAYGKAFAMGNQLLHAGYSAFCLNKACTNRLFRMLQQMDQNMVSLAAGYNDRNALIGQITRNGSLGPHTAPAESRFLRLYIVRKNLSLLHLPYHLRTGGRRRTIVFALNIAQYQLRQHIHN